jgi:thiamine pyrophosphate-dependent acetolactate synthase large subunit-like protein
MEMIVVSSEIHTKHINTVCGQNVDLCQYVRPIVGWVAQSV